EAGGHGRPDETGPNRFPVLAKEDRHRVCSFPRRGVGQGRSSLRGGRTTMSTAATTPAPAEPAAPSQVIVYGHSWLIYWWPVWVVGYLMALITWLNPVQVQIGRTQVLFASRTTLGVVYVLVVLVTILITNTQMRGLISLVVVLSAGFLALLFAYLHWWPDILRWFGEQAVFMNLGFYLF